MGTVVILALILGLGLLVAVQVASGRTRSAMTSLSPHEALEVFEQCFVAKANHIDRGVGQVLVRSRLKMHAPTLTAAARTVEGGTEVSVWMSDFVVLRYRGIPLGKYHAGWALRKQFKYLRRLRTLEAAPQGGRTESTEP